MRLWTKKVYEDWGGKCAVCGSTNLPNAHHLENRNTCRALRYDPMNGVLLCPSHHKWGKDSAHKGGIWFANWLMENHPDRFTYVLANRQNDINLNDRAVLANLEARLQPKTEVPIEPRPDPARETGLENPAGEHNLAPTEAEIRAKLDFYVKEGTCTKKEAEEVLNEYLVQLRKESHEGNAAIQG